MAEWQWGERVRLERFATIEGWPWVGFNMKRSSSAVVGAHLCPEHLEGNNSFTQGYNYMVFLHLYFKGTFIFALQTNV